MVHRCTYYCGVCVCVCVCVCVHGHSSKRPIQWVTPTGLSSNGAAIHRLCTRAVVFIRDNVVIQSHSHTKTGDTVSFPIPIPRQVIQSHSHTQTGDTVSFPYPDRWQDRCTVSFPYQYMWLYTPGSGSLLSLWQRICAFLSGIGGSAINPQPG